MLGHAELSTTEIYTQVSIRTLQAVHEATHPGATLDRHRTALEARGDDHVQLHDQKIAQAKLFSVFDSERQEENRPDPGSQELS